MDGWQQAMQVVMVLLTEQMDDSGKIGNY